MNTLKVLDSFTTSEEYEALYFYWFGIELPSSNRKQQLSELKRIEDAVVTRLKKESTESEIKQALTVISRDIESLNESKSRFNVSESYDKDIENLNSTKARINKIITEIGRMEIRKDLIIESKKELESEHVQVDTKQLMEIYKAAKGFIPKMQSSYEELIKFHNNMIKEKVDYIANELPELEKNIVSLNQELAKSTDTENKISSRLIKSGAIVALEVVIKKLNDKYEQKGKFEEQLKQWDVTNLNINNINAELDKINKVIASLDKELESKIKSFNKYFTTMSERLYGEQFILIPEHNKTAYQLRISSIDGNLGTGKKKGQMAAFDFAYMQFCKENKINCLNFILHDQIENIHGNQITTLAEISNETNSQFIVPVLKDKMPADLDVDNYKILSLSQDDKLFKVR